MSDSPNPDYTPPESPSPNPPGAPGSNIATRSKRLVAAIIDGFAGMALSHPVYQHFGVWDAVLKGTELSTQVTIGLTIFSLVLFFVLHGFLLMRYGQTLGKRIMGLAIVTLEGNKPDFAPLILNRYLPQWVVGVIPGWGIFLAVADVSYIFFNEQNRCLHDLLAKTKVIDLSIPVAASEPGNSFMA